jgi:hypothetical protein
MTTHTPSPDRRPCEDRTALQALIAENLATDTTDDSAD